ncbi:hypothetical protein BKA81DRAFT_372954 [Phyllosticta paracitricarpa]
MRVYKCHGRSRTQNKVYLAPTNGCSQARGADTAWTPIVHGSNGTAGAKRERAGGVKTSSPSAQLTEVDQRLKFGKSSLVSLHHNGRLHSLRVAGLPTLRALWWTAPLHSTTSARATGPSSRLACHGRWKSLATYLPTYLTQQISDALAQLILGPGQTCCIWWRATTMGSCCSSRRSHGVASSLSTSQNHDSSRAHIYNPSTAPQPHSTQSFLSATESIGTSRRASHSRPPPAAAASRRSGENGNKPAHDSNAAAAASSARGRGRGKKDSRPNKPLTGLDRKRRCKKAVLEGSVAASPGMPLTRARLETERRAFWETRVTGRAEMWGAVRLVVEMVQQGDVKGAQGVLDAAGGTCPTGQVWKGIYDELGSEYKVPEWVVVEPADIVVDDEEEGGDGEGESEEDMAGVDEKGKGKMGDMVKIKVRLSDRGTDAVVKVDLDENVRNVIARVVQAAELPPGCRVRLAYMGKLLRENESLAGQGYRYSYSHSHSHSHSDGHVISAFVF